MSGETEKILGLIGGILGTDFYELTVVRPEDMHTHSHQRIVAILYEDEVISLGKQYPYVVAPGAYPQMVSYFDQAVSRSIRLLVGTPIIPIEFEVLRARNLELEIRGADVEEKIRASKQELELALKTALEDLNRTKKDLEMNTRTIKSLDDQLRVRQSELTSALANRDQVRKDLAELKESVFRVMLLVSRGEASVKEMIESEKVAEIMGKPDGEAK